jgi:hypothetical protein
VADYKFADFSPERSLLTLTGRILICRISVVVLVVVTIVGRAEMVIGGNPARTVQTSQWTPPGIYLGFMPPSR